MPFSEIEQRCRLYLEDLLRIVIDQGDGRFTGNLFYVDLTAAKGLVPDESLRWKRENLAALAKDAKSVLEIGFAAGHSALLMLLSNPNLMLTVVDPCEYRHTVPCFEYLKEKFPGRLAFVSGYSPSALASLEDQAYDLVHLDGGKDLTISGDLDALKRLVKTGHVLCVDDTQNPGVDAEVKRRVSRGEIVVSDFEEMNSRSMQSVWTHCICRYN